MAGRTLPELWRDYLVLTREIGNFANRKEMDMVENLLAQRNKLQAAIDEYKDVAFRDTPEGRTILGEIADANAAAQQVLQRNINFARNRRAVSDAYMKY